MDKELLKAFKKDDLNLFLRLRSNVCTNISIIETQIDIDNPQEQKIENEYIHYAAKYNAVKIATSILDEDIETINIKNSTGKTPLKIAESCRQKKMVLLLVERNASLDELQPSDKKEVLKILVDHTMSLFASKTETPELRRVIDCIAKIKGCKKLDLLNLMVGCIGLKTSIKYFFTIASIPALFLTALGAAAGCNKVNLSSSSFVVLSTLVSSFITLGCTFRGLKECSKLNTVIDDLMELNSHFSEISQNLIKKNSKYKWNVSEDESSVILEIGKEVISASDSIGGIFPTKTTSQFTIEKDSDGGEVYIPSIPGSTIENDSNNRFSITEIFRGCCSCDCDEL